MSWNGKRLPTSTLNRSRRSPMGASTYQKTGSEKRCFSRCREVPLSGLARDMPLAPRPPGGGERTLGSGPAEGRRRYTEPHFCEISEKGSPFIFSQHRPSGSLRGGADGRYEDSAPCRSPLHGRGSSRQHPSPPRVGVPEMGEEPEKRTPRSDQRLRGAFLAGFFALFFAAGLGAFKMAARAAARRAMGTRKGEQLT